jgi:hypothetical protein
MVPATPPDDLPQQRIVRPFEPVVNGYCPTQRLNHDNMAAMSESDIENTTERLRVVLAQLHDMAEANIGRSKEIQARIDHLLVRLEAGEALPDIVDNETRPLIPELVTQNIEALQEVGLLLRQAEARALRAHGYTLGRIGELFGVTRQRVGYLLSDQGPRSA